MATKTTTKRGPAKPPATTEAAASKPPPVLEVGSEEWKEEVRRARARILAGRVANPDHSLKRVAELVNEHDDAARRGDTERCEKIRGRLTDRSARDGDWLVDPTGAPKGARLIGWDKIQVAVLMDIRRRLDTIIDRLPEKEPRA